jgi:MinD superfamily P-loop ATPase
MIITIAGGKGGTGKSMVASSLAYEYAKQQKTLLVDADVECPNDHLLLNIPLKQVETIYQPIPKWNDDMCIQCGKCAEVCKQQAIVFSPGKTPAFVEDICIGCKACFVVCPVQAIEEDKKEIGTIYQGKNYNVELVSGELKLGQLASGEIVSAVRKYSEDIEKQEKPEIIIIDAAAGIGCPVIASIVGSDYLLAVTEPTPSALHDLKRVIHLARHFRIPHGLIINKADLEKQFCANIMNFAKKENIPVLGKVPYSKNFIDASLKMCPVAKLFPHYNSFFEKLAKILYPKALVKNVLS